MELCSADVAAAALGATACSNDGAGCCEGDEGEDERRRPSFHQRLHLQTSNGLWKIPDNTWR